MGKKNLRKHITMLSLIEDKARRYEPLTEVENDFIADAFRDILDGHSADNALGITGKQGRNIKDLLGRNFDIVWRVDVLLEDRDNYTTTRGPKNGKTNVFEAVKKQAGLSISAQRIKGIYYDTHKEVDRRIALDAKLRLMLG